MADKLKEWGKRTRDLEASGTRDVQQFTATGRLIWYRQRICYECLEAFLVERHRPVMKCERCRGLRLPVVRGPRGDVQLEDLHQVDALISMLRRLGFVDDVAELLEDGRVIFDVR